MSLAPSDIAGMRITVMGLGLHGGGAASAKFFAARGAEVTVTDLRSEAELSGSIKELEAFPVRYVLGTHDARDFTRADMVIKNPGVPGNSPFLAGARRVETDISIFLRLVDPPLIAVTGSKGKSTTVSALHHIMKEKYPRVKLGGNITISPLSFADELLETAGDVPPVILELSSWQLADLRSKDVLHPEIACITNILHDHQNRYSRFSDYIDDKREIYLGQKPEGKALFLFDDHGKRFGREAEGKVFFFSAEVLPGGIDGAWLTKEGEGFLRQGGEIRHILPENIEVPGRHNRLNLLCAAAIASMYGISDEDMLRRRAAEFPGIPHRLEYAGEAGGLRFYNDSAATIPDAVLHGVRSFSEPCVLITGGTDKELDFSPYRTIAGEASAIVLLAGSGTEKIVSILRKQGIPFYGPFEEMEPAVRTAADCAPSGAVVLLSPGCASFEYFTNEFHRGNLFKEAVEKLN